MAICQNCGASASRGAVFCRACYRQVAAGPGGKLHPDARCPECGAPMHYQSQRCPSCAARARQHFPDGAEPSQRTCEGCGGLRNRNAKLCRKCQQAALEGDAVKRGHDRAERLYSLDGVRCEYKGCRAPALDRHHIDGNTLNNDPSNIARYCRRHHMVVDGRLDRFRAAEGNRGNRLGASGRRPLRLG